jgi:hypothetical protein
VSRELPNDDNQLRDQHLRDKSDSIKGPLLGAMGAIVGAALGLAEQLELGGFKLPAKSRSQQ